MKEINYMPKKAKILERRSLSPETISLRLKPIGKPFRSVPGQFVMISVAGFGEIPLGITTPPGEKYFEVGVRSVGMVTKKTL